MNEQDFRDALRQTMAVSTAPPPMSDGDVLDAARRDRKRRHAMWAGGGSAAAVVAVAVGVAVLASSASGGGVGVGGQPPEAQSTDAPNTENTQTFPSGMTDRTAYNGPHYDKGNQVAVELATSIPAGYESPDDLTAAYGFTLKSHQASWDGTIDGNEFWKYLAIAPLTKGEGVGQLTAQVNTPGNPDFSGETCEMLTLYHANTNCSVVMVDGKKVGLGESRTSDGLVVQYAAYRHEDGTAVLVSQSAQFEMSGKPALDGMPMTGEQLAALSVDPKFNLD